MILIRGVSLKNKQYVLVAEYRLLSALARNRAFVEDSRIYIEIFPHQMAQSVYKAIKHLWKHDIKITESSLYQIANELDFNVTEEVIQKVLSITDKPNVLDDMLRVLAEEVQKLKLLSVTDELRKTVSNSFDKEELFELLYKADKVIRSTTTNSILKDTEQWTSEYIEDLKERAKGITYSYGDVFLDQLLYKGAYPGAITTIAAATGQGKSTFVLNLINQYIEMQIPAMYVSLEMSGIDTFDRLLGLRKEIPASALYRNDSSLLDIIPIVQKERKVLNTNKRFFFVEEPHISIARLYTMIKEFKQRTGQDYAIVAIDLVTQLTDFVSSTNKMSVANAIEHAMNELNALAKEMNVHIIAVAQFNRDADNYKVSSIEDLDILRPSLNNIKNSAAIAERSRVVLGLFRKKFYADRYLQDIPEAEIMEDILEVNILKNSSGPVGHRLNYLFDGTFFKITPYVQSDIDKKLEEQKLNF